jgi:hypothetical protein
VSQVSARELNPTFLMVWLGNNDILRWATARTERDRPTGRSSPAHRQPERSRIPAPTWPSPLPDVTNIAVHRRRPR